MKGRRDGVILATKFGIVREGNSVNRGVNGHPDYVRSACEASLERLGVERIDLYYQHRVDPNLVPIRGTTSPRRLLENVQSVEVHLNEEELDVIGAAAPRGVAEGERYHPNMMTLLNG